MGGEDGSSSLDKSGAAVLSKGATADDAASLESHSLPGLYERSRSLTSSLANETTVGLKSAKTLAENAGCLRGMEISMDCGSLPYRERREVDWIEQSNKAKEEIQAFLPNVSETDQDGSNFGFLDIMPYALGGILLLLAIGVALYTSFYYSY